MRRLLSLIFILWAASAFAQFTPGTPIEPCDRGDEDPISDGGAWTTDIISTDASTVICGTGLIDKGAAAGTGSAWRNDATYGHDVQASFQYTDSEGANNSIDIYFTLNPGVASSTDGYGCRIWGTDANARWLLVRVDNSSNTTLVDRQIGTDPTTPTIADNDVVGCEMIGDVLTAYHCPGGTNCVSVVTDADGDNTYTGPWSVGMRFASTSTYAADDFWAATFVEAASVPPVTIIFMQ